jgi:prepilin-type N-terminal cleavage/methylation domain-containing protein
LKKSFRSRRSGGFTLIELMIIVAILSILALVVLPKFGAMVQKSKEASTKGQLGAARGAVNIAYHDNDQTYPASFASLFPRYLDVHPVLYTTDHPLSETVDDLVAWDPSSDSANWGYVTAGDDIGKIAVQCTHVNSANKIWSME